MANGKLSVTKVLLSQGHSAASLVDCNIRVRYWIYGPRGKKATFSLTLAFNDGTESKATINYDGYPPLSFGGGSFDGYNGSVPKEIFDPNSATLTVDGNLWGLDLWSIQFNFISENGEARRRFIFHLKSEGSTIKTEDSVQQTTMIVTMRPMDERYDFLDQSTFENPYTFWKTLPQNN